MAPGQGVAKNRNYSHISNVFDQDEPEIREFIEKTNDILI